MKVDNMMLVLQKGRSLLVIFPNLSRSNITDPRRVRWSMRVRCDCPTMARRLPASRVFMIIRRLMIETRKILWQEAYHVGVIKSWLSTKMMFDSEEKRGDQIKGANLALSQRLMLCNEGVR